MNAYLAAQKYCSTVECRRSTLLNYFGESLPNANCGHCDNCLREGVVTHCNMSEEAHLLLTAVKSCGGKWGIGLPIDVLRGSTVCLLFPDLLKESLPTWKTFFLLK
jgi:ATP-dependent DNA helicase RecQ